MNKGMRSCLVLDTKIISAKETIIGDYFNGISLVFIFANFASLR